MSDPQRAVERPAEALSGAERDARIEQLLLAGLDRYFAADYEQAINLWTRVLFLDRAHDRARAYIERARSAQAERQRESDVILHEGLRAFDEGDVTRARELVSTALDRGASDDAALGVLRRLDRLETRPGAVRRAVVVHPPDEAEPQRRPSRRPAEARYQPARGWWPFVVLVVVGAAIAAGWGVAGAPPQGWTAWLVEPGPAVVTAVPVRPIPVEVPLASEAYLSRARVLHQAGRPRDALRELDRIGLADRVRPEADRLRADVQQTLLDLARLPVAPLAAASAPRDPE